MDAFLSYTAEDKPFADRLRRDLESQGIARISDAYSVLPGESWVEKIQSQISAAKIVLLVISINSARSEFLSAEIALALSKKWEGNEKRIIPILADTGAEIPFFLRDIQYVDLSTESLYQSNLHNLILAIRQEPKAGGDQFSGEDAKLAFLDAQRTALVWLSEEHARTRASKLQHAVFTISSAALASITTAMILSISFVDTTWFNRSLFIGLIAGVAGSLIAIRLPQILVDALSNRRPGKKDAENG